MKKHHLESKADLTDKERQKAARDGKRLAGVEVRKKVSMIAAPVRQEALEKVQARVAQKRLALEQETSVANEAAAENVSGGDMAVTRR